MGKMVRCGGCLFQNIKTHKKKTRFIFYFGNGLKAYQELNQWLTGDLELVAGFNPGPNKNHLFCAGKRHEPIDSSEKVCKSWRDGYVKVCSRIGSHKATLFSAGPRRGLSWSPMESRVQSIGIRFPNGTRTLGTWFKVTIQQPSWSYGGFLKRGIPKSPWVSILKWSSFGYLVVPPPFEETSKSRACFRGVPYKTFYY